MSSNDRETRICTSIEEEGFYNMLKPVNPNDLWNVWQYAAGKEEEKAVVAEETSNCAGETSSLPSKRDDSHDQDDVSANPALMNDENTENLKGGTKRKTMEMYGEHISAPPRKAKIVWTNTLHDWFLRAIDILGMDKAVPRKILEIMNVPGLTRENIASHLQKYRLFLKRYGKNNSLKFKSPEKSDFAPNTLPLSSSSNEHSRLLQLGFGKVPSFIHDENPNFLQNLTPGAQSSCSTLPSLGLEKSHPFVRQTSACSGLLSSIQIPTTTLGLNVPLQANTTYTHPKDNLSPLDLYKHQSQQNGTIPYSGFIPSTFGFNNGLALNTIQGIDTIGSSVIRSEVLSRNPPISNFAGIRLTSNGELVGRGGGGGSLLQFNDIVINGLGKNNPNEFDMTNLQGLPPMAGEQQFVANQGDNSNFKVDNIKGPALPIDNNNYYQQPLGNGDHNSVFKGLVNQPCKNGRYILDRPNILGSYIGDYENNAPSNEQSEFSNLYHIQDSILPGDPSSIQQQGANAEQLLESILPPLSQKSMEHMGFNENTMVNDQDQVKEEYVEAMLRTMCELLED